MAKDSDLEESTVFAEPEEGGTLALSHPPSAPIHVPLKTPATDQHNIKLEVKTDPENTQSVRNERAERNTMPESEQLIGRTGYAAEGVRVAVLFAHKFGRRVLGSRAHLTVKLNEPGVSTESGAKARQSIVLVPKSKGRGTSVIGWIDMPRCLAEIRSYALIAEQHRTRHGDEIDVGRDEYEALRGDLESFLRGTGITPTLSESSGAIPKSGLSNATKRAEVQMTTRTIFGIIALILVIGIFIGVFASRGCGARVDDEAQFQNEPEPPAQVVPPKRRLSPFRSH